MRAPRGVEPGAMPRPAWVREACTRDSRRHVLRNWKDMPAQVLNSRTCGGMAPNAAKHSIIVTAITL